MTDRYAVVGNPIAHSKSPRIHAEFARQTGQDLSYAAMLAPLDGFRETVLAFRDGGGKGMNITVPFKEQAFRLATELSARALDAEAVNTFRFDGQAIHGDNTDGAGLVSDIIVNLGLDLAGKRILVMGAGGAARGVILPLLETAPARLVLANRTVERAVALVTHFGPRLPPGGLAGGLAASAFADLDESFDLVINATAASLAGELPPLPDAVYAPGALAYEMMYGRETPFMAHARARGARVADGLGMLVEQAAEAFFLWRGVRPATAPVIAMLREG